MATSDGVLYVGNIVPREGGECRISKEFRLFGGDCYPTDDDSATESTAVSFYHKFLSWNACLLNKHILYSVSMHFHLVLCIHLLCLQYQ